MSKINQYKYAPACPDVPTSSSSSFSLITRQQPIHARISTNNERDRRPIDPPPIVQIRLNNATPQQTDTFHQNSYFFMCANLAHPINEQEIYTPTHNALSGQTVSSMYKLKDINNHDGAFFIFGDLSVKVEGSFRLKLSLFGITSTGAFPGMLNSTFLSRSFSDQGARIRIRKENRALAPMATAPSSSSSSRKKKLEIQTAPLPATEKYVSAILPPPTQQEFSTIAPAGIHQSYQQTSPTVAPPTTPPALIETRANYNGGSCYYERRASITSSSTECSNETSPVMTHFSSSSPRVVSLPPLSPSQQSYDVLFGTTYRSPTTSLITTANFDPTVKLPPIRNFGSFKRQKTTTTEEDAILAMMQLSSSPSHNRLF